MKVTCLLKDFGTSESGRIYSKEVMEKAVKDYMSMPKHKRLGELSPKGDEMNINLSNVSHKIENMAFIGNKLYCEVELLDTPCGKEAQELIKNDLPLHLSPRMIAQPIYELDEDGNPTNKIIGYDNLDIISVNIIDP